MQKKFKATLKCIHDFIELNNYPPSVREICAEVGFKSTASAQYYLKKLVEEGFINKSASKNRTIDVDEAKYEEFFEIEKEPVYDPNILSVPFLGNIAAGLPLYAGVNVDESFSIPSNYFTYNGPTFMLRVVGDSMMNMGIYNNDIVLIKKQNVARNGDVVVAQLDNNEVTLKRFFRKSYCVILRPENNRMEDIIVTQDHDVKILGIAIGLMRNSIQ